MTIAIIGMGAAGGNIADEFAKNGGDFVTGAINFSQKDLDSLDSVHYKQRLIGSDGMGHNRNNAIPLISKHPEMAINFINKYFINESIDLIFFPFSTGGGSGSGMAQIILDLISNMYPEKSIIAMPILPAYNESPMSQANTLDLFNEISQYNIGILPIDNQQKVKESKSAQQLYSIINTQVVQSINKIIKYTDQHSKEGNFDSRDFLTIFQTKGFFTISSVDLSKLDQLENINLAQNSFKERIIKSWNDSVFAPIERSRILKSAFIYDGQEKLLNFINLPEVFKAFNNEPLDTFTGIYENEQKGNVTMILSGLDVCKTRLSKIQTVIAQKSESLQGLDNHQSVQFKNPLEKYSFMTKISSPTQEKKAMKVSDILSKYKR